MTEKKQRFLYNFGRRPGDRAPYVKADALRADALRAAERKREEAELERELDDGWMSND